MSSQAELTIDVRNGVWESHVWHAGEQALYWKGCFLAGSMVMNMAASACVVCVHSYHKDSKMVQLPGDCITPNGVAGMLGGAALDEDAGFWICVNDAGLGNQSIPKSKLDRSLPAPVKNPATCAFGGATLGTLFVTSFAPGGIDVSDQPLAGGLFTLRPGIRGLVEATVLH